MLIWQSYADIKQVKYWSHVITICVLADTVNDHGKSKGTAEADGNVISVAGI